MRASISKRGLIWNPAQLCAQYINSVRRVYEHVPAELSVALVVMIVVTMAAKGSGETLDLVFVWTLGLWAGLLVGTKSIQ